MTQNFSIHLAMLDRVEKRAMDVANEKHPYMMKLAGGNPIIIDPYVNYAPADTQVWLDLFVKVHENRELYARLFFIRGAGTVLVNHPKWGYVFQPVIGHNGWSSMNEYNQEKQCLNDYQKIIIDILYELSMTKRVGA